MLTLASFTSWAYLAVSLLIRAAICSVVSPTGLGNTNFGQLLLLVLAVVGGLFLVIQFVALIIGFVLARQITGAVHDLDPDVERVILRCWASSPSRST